LQSLSIFFPPSICPFSLKMEVNVWADASDDVSCCLQNPTSHTWKRQDTGYIQLSRMRANLIHYARPFRLRLRVLYIEQGVVMESRTSHRYGSHFSFYDFLPACLTISPLFTWTDVSHENGRKSKLWCRGTAHPLRAQRREVGRSSACDRKCQLFMAGKELLLLLDYFVFNLGQRVLMHEPQLWAETTEKLVH
jgi:hypothetical protein